MADEQPQSNLDKLKGLRVDYKKVFDTEEGKRVMEDLENTGFYNTTTFVPNDSMATVFNEGLRAFLLHIKTVKDMDLEKLERLATAAQRGGN